MIDTPRAGRRKTTGVVASRQASRPVLIPQRQTPTFVRLPTTPSTQVNQAKRGDRGGKARRIRRRARVQGPRPQRVQPHMRRTPRAWDPGS